MGKLTLQTIRASILGILLFGALVFLPAWTFDYWQAWVFIITFIVVSTPVTIWLAIRDPKLLEKRMQVGPSAEQTPAQKVITSLFFVGFIALMVVPALDHRFSWSDMSPAVSIGGDVLIAISYVWFFFVFRENSYGAANIRRQEGQPVISTGPYAIVRHPMYSGALLMLVGVPLALGSWWGLLGVPVFIAVLIWRILDEEKFLAANLAGYSDYLKKLRWRLVPGIF